jgi:hypothetical protein
VWAPAATSLRARLKRPPLPKALGSAMLIHCRELPSMLNRGPRSVPWVDERGRRGRQVAKFSLPALIVGWRSDGVDYSQD